MEIKSVRQCVVEQLEELELKINKLHKFIKGEGFNLLNEENKYLLCLQLSSMKAYSEVLKKRLVVINENEFPRTSFSLTLTKNNYHEDKEFFNQTAWDELFTYKDKIGHELFLCVDYNRITNSVSMYGMLPESREELIEKFRGYDFKNGFGFDLIDDPLFMSMVLKVTSSVNRKD